MPDRDTQGIGRRPVLGGAALFGAAALMPGEARPQNESRGTAVADGLTAEDIRSLLDLQPNATCGFVRVTFRTAEEVAPGGLPAPFSDGRPLGSALYFMVTPEAPVHLHCI